MQHPATFARRSCSRVVTFGLSWLAVASPALAQATEPEVAVVTALAESPSSEDVRRGLDALQAGKFADAVSAFQAAYDRDADLTALLNLGNAYLGLGQPHAAAHAWNAYLAKADPVRDAQSIQQVQAELERLQTTSGRIQLNLSPDGTVVRIDGEVVTPDANVVWVAPGKRSISATAEGYIPFLQTLDVLAGQFTLDIQLQRMAPVSVASATPALRPAKPATEIMHEPTDEPEASAAGSCALSQVCVGPVMALLGPPNLVGGGMHMRFGRYLGAGVDYQVLPTLNFNPVSVGASLVSVNARVYPFGGSLFLGGGVGYQSIRGQLHDGDIQVGARAGFPAAMASIGFMGHDGFVLGADIGLLFPLGSTRVSIQNENSKLASSGTGVTQADVDAATSKAETQVNKLMGALPMFLQVNLLRVGYLF
jgi:hypothetical protein